MLEWQARRHELRARRLAAAGGGRGRRAGREVSDAPPVEARGLVKRYGEIVAVDHVDLDVERGDVFGYLGPNGAGKTTSLRMLLGLIRPTEGSARLFGRDPLIDGAKALDGVAGFVEGPRFYPYLSGRAQPRACSPTTTSRSRARGSTRCSSWSSCATARRTGSAATRTGCASGSGSRRRCCAQPRLLLLDEPTTGLDPAGMRDMRDLVRRLAGEGITILLSSHLLYEVEELCNRVAIIRKGRDRLPGRAARPARDRGERLPAARRRAGAGARGAARPARHRRRASRATASFGSPPTRTPSPRSRVALGQARIAFTALVPETASLEELFLGMTDGESSDHDRPRGGRGMTAVARVYRWEVAKLLAQKRTYLGLGAAMRRPDHLRRRARAPDAAARTTSRSAATSATPGSPSRSSSSSSCRSGGCR